MEMMTDTIEEVVREVLGLTYDRFGFHENAELIESIVRVLKDPSKNWIDAEGEASNAAETVRSWLGEAYIDGGNAASATAYLFCALQREEELGWITEQVPGGRYGI
jgi:hypothetical protein